MNNWWSELGADQRWDNVYSTCSLPLTSLRIACEEAGDGAVLIPPKAWGALVRSEEFYDIRKREPELRRSILFGLVEWTTIRSEVQIVASFIGKRPKDIRIMGDGRDVLFSSGYELRGVIEP